MTKIRMDHLIIGKFYLLWKMNEFLNSDTNKNFYCFSLREVVI